VAAPTFGSSGGATGGWETVGSGSTFAGGGGGGATVGAGSGLLLAVGGFGSTGVGLVWGSGVATTAGGGWVLSVFTVLQPHTRSSAAPSARPRVANAPAGPLRRQRRLGASAGYRGCRL
jgi:hypothetical protein